jgi:dephospho-CoA kinase
MAVIGITGGIASGKSTFCRALAAIKPVQVFDSDSCARGLLDSDRAAIRAVVFSDFAAKARLEAILHPLVRKRRLVLADEALAEGRDLLVDIPLLFESGALPGFDCVVTVACSPEIQIQRAMSRGLAPAQVEQIIASQWSNSQKIAQSDFVIWNDGSMRTLEAQAVELACRLESRREK